MDGWGWEPLRPWEGHRGSLTAGAGPRACFAALPGGVRHRRPGVLSAVCGYPSPADAHACAYLPVQISFGA
jgi:hypothetical protein